MKAQSKLVLNLLAGLSLQYRHKWRFPHLHLMRVAFIWFRNRENLENWEPSGICFLEFLHILDI